MNKNLPVLPECFGTYEEAHPSCNGDPGSDDLAERRPCAERERCAPLTEAKTLVRPSTPSGPKRVKVIRPSEKAMTLLEFFRERLLAEMNDGEGQHSMEIDDYRRRRVSWAPDGQAPVPGQLYMADLIDSSHYVNFSLRLGDPRVPVRPIARLYFNNEKFSVAFPCDAPTARREANSSDVTGIRIAPDGATRAGGFRSRTPMLERGGVGAAARLAARLHRRWMDKGTKGMK